MVINSLNHTIYCEWWVLGNILEFDQILFDSDLGELG
jgi:hypothetical protein